MSALVGLGVPFLDRAYLAGVAPKGRNDHKRCTPFPPLTAPGILTRQPNQWQVLEGTNRADQARTGGTWRATLKMYRQR